MAFNAQKLKTISKTLGLTEENTITFLRRQSGFLKNNMNQVFRSYTLLKEIREVQIQEEVKSLKKRKLFKTKNLIISKYMDTIIKLYQKDRYGAQRIANHLKINHASVVSKSALESFFKNNEISREVRDK